MGKMVRDLIEYNGIDMCPYKNIANFKQLNTDYIFCIPDEKPDVEQVIRVWAEACIVESKIVSTPVGTSYEGSTVTGYKLLITGDINLKVQYAACNQLQSVHTAHSKFPFSGYVVLPENTNINGFISPNIVIEDIFTEQMDCRCLYNNITMMLVAYSC